MVAIARDHGVALAPRTSLPFLFHWGRQASAVAFYGCKLTPEDVQHAIMRVPALTDAVEHYALHPYEDDSANKRLEIWLELRSGIADLGPAERARDDFLRALATVNQDYRESSRMIAAERLPTFRVWRYGESPLAGQDIRIKKRYIV